MFLLHSGETNMARTQSLPLKCSSLPCLEWLNRQGANMIVIGKQRTRGALILICQEISFLRKTIFPPQQIRLC